MTELQRVAQYLGCNVSDVWYLGEGIYESARGELVFVNPDGSIQYDSLED